jgi:hypothetical protein
MVKNTLGGTGTKGLARKHQVIRNKTLQLAEDELECYACVTKLFGNRMVEIVTTDEKLGPIRGHIRSKFSGKQKRHNTITQFAIVLVGLREWESIRKNCDILTVYDDIEIEQLSQMPKINIESLLQMRLSGTFKGKTADTNNMNFGFIDEQNEDSANNSNKTHVVEQFGLETVNEVDIDDI